MRKLNYTGCLSPNYSLFVSDEAGIYFPNPPYELFPMSVLKNRSNHRSNLLDKNITNTVLNFQPSADGKTGICDTYNYNFRTNKFWYKLTMPLINFVIGRGWKITVEGKENIPKDGNYILMPNHVSHFDSFLCATRFNSAPIAIADEKLYKNKYFRIIARLYNAFPVRKGTKSTAIVEYGISRVNKGDSMLWFPEGQRHKNPSSNRCNPGKLGSGMFAHGITAPIVPVFISGAEFAMPVGKPLSMGRGPRSIKVGIKYGKPVPLDDLRELPPSKETSQKVVNRIMEHIEKLRPKGPYMVQKNRHWQTKENYKP